MKIIPKVPEIARPESLKVPSVPTPAAESKPQPSSAPRADQVQISDAGRALAEQRTESAQPALSSERAAQIRMRVLEGAYNSLDVVDEVARRILDSGDL